VNKQMTRVFLFYFLRIRRLSFNKRDKYTQSAPQTAEHRAKEINSYTRSPNNRSSTTKTKPTKTTRKTNHRIKQPKKKTQQTPNRVFKPAAPRDVPSLTQDNIGPILEMGRLGFQSCLAWTVHGQLLSLGPA
jgi:hypothetical protein